MTAGILLFSLLVQYLFYHDEFFVYLPVYVYIQGRRFTFFVGRKTNVENLNQSLRSHQELKQKIKTLNVLTIMCKNR